MKRFLRYGCCLVCFVLIFGCILQGQEVPDYQSAMIANPAVSGMGGDGILRLSYRNIYPGNTLNLHSVSLSYDSYFPGLHGGAGFYLTDEYLGGIINNLSGGVSYSYLLQATEKVFISAGLSASLYHRGYDLRNAVFPDQIDPLSGAVMPSAEAMAFKGRTVFDLATGFMVMAGKFFGGFSVCHLAEPDPSGSDLYDGRLGRVLYVHGAGDLILDREKGTRLVPFGNLSAGREMFSSGAGLSAESKYLSVNGIVLIDNNKNLDMQTGFSITFTAITLFYNYRFNLISGDDLVPFSLQHHTGIALGLNNVDKRKAIKTINFPKL